VRASNSLYSSDVNYINYMNAEVTIDALVGLQHPAVFGDDGAPVGPNRRSQHMVVVCGKPAFPRLFSVAPPPSGPVLNPAWARWVGEKCKEGQDDVVSRAWEFASVFGQETSADQDGSSSREHIAQQSDASRKD
jgi:hypothetical protein